MSRAPIPTFSSKSAMPLFSPPLMDAELYDLMQQLNALNDQIAVEGVKKLVRNILNTSPYSY